MSIVFRAPQIAALAALENHWAGGGASSLISMATGIGKSLVLAEIIRRAAQGDCRRVMIATHVRELIEQGNRGARHA